MALFDHLAGLSVDIGSVTTETIETRVDEEFPRTTTVVTLHGGDATGLGEDVIYDRALHTYPDGLEAALRGSRRLDELSDRLSARDLFPQDSTYDAIQANYRRWAVESAALDLALKQHGTNVARALGLEYRPVRFVVSPSAADDVREELHRWIDRVPGIEFKLDAKAEWDRKVVADLAALDRVRIVDFKSHYEGFGREPDYELYRTVAEGFDDVILEDPKLTPETRPALAGHEHRVSWDKPVTGVESIEQLPFTPSYLNVKPSRLGSVESLLDTIEYCRDEGISIYVGGQFELGVGRQHVQAVASLFAPDGPNDVAPLVYGGPDVPENPPESPLDPTGAVDGLEWRVGES